MEKIITLKQWLSENGVTQSWLAKTLNVHRLTVSRWVSGKTIPHLSVIGKIQTITRGGVVPESFIKPKENINE
jgi:transcriptional regulator with XRE-family HTH domain